MSVATLSGPCVALALTPWEPAELRALLPAAEEILVLSTDGADRRDGDVSYLRVRGTAFYSTVRALLPGRRHVIVVDDDGHVPLRWFRGLYWAGVRGLWIRHRGEWRLRDLLPLVIERHGRSAGQWLLRSVARLTLKSSGGDGRLSWRRLVTPPVEWLLRIRVAEPEWLSYVARHVEARPGVPAAPLDAVLYVGSLNAGGAERQHANLAIGLAKRGYRVRLLTLSPLQGEEAHYLPLLARLAIPASRAGGPLSLSGQYRLDPTADRLVSGLPYELRTAVLDLVGELLVRMPQVLHATLDYSNVIGAAAGILAGVPHIVVSTRNANPTHFAFYEPWMDHWYRFLARLPNVQFIANSRYGAEDYARWSGIPLSRFNVVLNGIDLESLREPPAAEIAAVRAELCVGPDTPLVAGVFRLAPEKQPLLFLDVAAKVAAAVPRLRVVLAGTGPELERVEAGIVERGLASVVSLVGQRRDVDAILSAADVLLLTSLHEGTPNVVLEAQWFGCPPVLTAAGGSPETIVPGVTAFIHPIRDTTGLAESVIRLLQDADLRRRMAEAGRRHVRERFSLDDMVEETLKLYPGRPGGLAEPPIASGTRTP